MKITLGVVLAVIGVILLALGITGTFGWETNIGLDAVGAALLLAGVLLSLKIVTPGGVGIGG